MNDNTEYKTEAEWFDEAKARTAAADKAGNNMLAVVMIVIFFIVALVIATPGCVVPCE